MKKPPSPVAVRAGKIEFLRTNFSKQGLRDLYRTILSLSWPRFALAVLAVYLVLNLAFATAYLLGGPCIAEMQPGSFSSAFFYSVQTLSTVGFVISCLATQPSASLRPRQSPIESHTPPSPPRHAPRPAALTARGSGSRT